MDKRRHNRVLFSTPVAFAAGGRPFQRDTINISATGMRIRTSEAVQPGEDITLCFTLHEPLKVQGKAVWFGKNGLGVKFNTTLK